MITTVNFEATQAWGGYAITDEDIEVEVPDNFYLLPEDERWPLMKEAINEWLSDTIAVVVTYQETED